MYLPLPDRWWPAVLLQIPLQLHCSALETVLLSSPARKCLSVGSQVCRDSGSVFNKKSGIPASVKTKLFCETSSGFELDNRTSKTEQVYETWSMFELDNVKNEIILREFFIF